MRHSAAVTFLRRWWWPVYAFLYPVVFWPYGERYHLDSFTVRACLTALALAGGFLLEWSARPAARLADVRRLPLALRRHPAVALALAYGVWAVVVSAWAPSPEVSLTGSLSDGSDGALWTLALSFVFALAYLAARREPAMGRRLAAAVALAGGLLAAVGLAEVVLGHGLVFAPAERANLPMATFPQRGHLAGFLTLAGGTAAGLWLAAWWPALPALFAACLGVGLAYNRAALLGLAGALALCLRVPRRAAIAALVAGLGVVAGFGAAKIGETQGGRELASSRSLFSRAVFWKAAANGVLARPLTGYGGGGQFEYHWFRHLSKPDLDLFFQREYGLRRVVETIGGGNYGTAFAVEDAKGKQSVTTVVGWKAHNQFLDTALLWGLPGLALYLGLLALGLRGLRALAPASLGLLAYHVFLLLWYIPVHAEGTVFALLATACAAVARPVLGRSRRKARPALEPAPA